MKPTLQWFDDKLGLLLPKGNPVIVDFESVIESRLKEGTKKPAILRACKLEPEMLVLDATAGLGRDAALLASTGARVIMCERSPILQQLLTDGLKRITNASLNLNLMTEDAKTYLERLTSEHDFPDVIYLDPMHPLRTKSAKVKKDLEALQLLLGPDNDVADLLKCARQYAKKKVVVKWPRNKLSLVTPSYTLEGKTVKFDVYATSSQK